jgi:hypothetical protein
MLLLAMADGRHVGRCSDTDAPRCFCGAVGRAALELRVPYDAFLMLKHTNTRR